MRTAGPRDGEGHPDAAEEEEVADHALRLGADDVERVGLDPNGLLNLITPTSAAYGTWLRFVWPPLLLLLLAVLSMAVLTVGVVVQ